MLHLQQAKHYQRKRLLPETNNSLTENPIVIRLNIFEKIPDYFLKSMRELKTFLLLKQ